VDLARGDLFADHGGEEADEVRVAPESAMHRRTTD